MPTIAKQDADAYDRMIDAAAELADLIDRGPIELDEYVLEELTIFLASHPQEVRQLLKHLKYKWP